MNIELSTKVEETEEQFGKRLETAKAIVNRRFGVITDADIKGRLVELETRANWAVGDYHHLSHQKLLTHWADVKRYIDTKSQTRNYSDN